MIISRLQPEAINGIIHLQEEAVQNGDEFIPSSQEVYQRAFQFQNFVFGVYSDKNELLAFCNCSIPTVASKINLGRGILKEEYLNSVGHVNTIIVQRNWRKKGIGKELILSALDEFKQRDIKYIFVVVSPNNQSSLLLFQKMGFRCIKNILYKGFNRNLLQSTLNEL